MVLTEMASDTGTVQYFYPKLGIRAGVFSVLFWIVLVFSILANPIAGVFWDSRLIVLVIYFLRDFFVLFSPFVLIFYALNNKYMLLAGAMLFGALYFFISYFLISDVEPAAEIVFLQYRNTFGFLLAWGFGLMYYDRLSMDRIRRLCTGIIIFLFVYCTLEFILMLLFNFNFANDIFNKTLLEATKGTKANLDAGILGVLRVPGPLFSPSQLGIMLGYFYFVARVIIGGPKSILLGLLVLIVEIIAVSKTGIAMILLAEGMLFMSRRWAFIALFAILIGPWLADFILFPFLDRYHAASAAFHFAGYISGLHGLFLYPFGVGIGNAGTLAATLRDIGLSFGNESGLATIFGNLGIFGVIMLLLIFIQMSILKNPDYMRFFVLYIASIAFNENALSPYLFVIPLVLIVSHHHATLSQENFLRRI